MQYVMENKTVRLPQDMLADVERGAEQNDMSESEYIRTAIRNFRQKEVAMEEREA